MLIGVLVIPGNIFHTLHLSVAKEDIMLSECIGATFNLLWSVQMSVTIVVLGGGLEGIPRFLSDIHCTHFFHSRFNNGALDWVDAEHESYQLSHWRVRVFP